MKHRPGELVIHPGSRWRRLGSIGRGAAINWVLPVLLACSLTIALHRRLYPPVVKVAVVQRSGFGPLRLRLQLPLHHAGIPEPLVVCGEIGSASLVYVRLLPHARARVGIEFWGLELDQGPEFPLSADDAQIVVTCEVPAFYPEEGSAAWGKVARDVQSRRRHEFRVAVDGIVRLEGRVNYRLPEHAPIYFGANPLGGSFVSSLLTAKILQVSQEF
jgi:hypothetical protein